MKTESASVGHPGGDESRDGDLLASDDDAACMALALDEARAAFAQDEVPIGAVIVRPVPDREDLVELIARAHNRTRSERDPCAHAEILAIRQAAARLAYQRLDGCTLYSTVEPCFMCAGALIHARLARVVWAVRDPKFGACASLGEVLDHPHLNHRVAHDEGVGAEEARTLMQEFFRSKR